MSTIAVTPTTEGTRVWLQGLDTKGFYGGERYHVTYGTETIEIQAAPEGKRKITASKGGVIDLESQKVTTWAQGHTRALVVYDRARSRIIITRAH